MTSSSTDQKVKPTNIVIIDAGLGNIASVANMLRRAGAQAFVSRRVEDIEAAPKLILPGVGSFDHGIRQLHAHGLFAEIQHRAAAGVPILGICLGMQLLSHASEEGVANGLGLIDAEFKRFAFGLGDHNLPVPHVGWNEVDVVKENSLLDDNAAIEQRFYFTHSYHAVCADSSDVLATTEYGYTFPAAYSRGNIHGVQFHPEKSHRFGMSLLKKFADL